MNKYQLMRNKRDDDVLDNAFEKEVNKTTAKKAKGDLKIHGNEDER